METGNNGFGEVNLPITITGPKLAVSATTQTSSSTITRTVSYASTDVSKVKLLTKFGDSVGSMSAYYICFCK